ncbi:HNH endonuclease [Paraliobacillus sp. JSM ZJ581]|uniref:HNH endonuclease n=1 Tax=Paraliobacillus sp. JSM ZJ581 TaxID=3342118 RepID=UPI0035A81FAC
MKELVEYAVASLTAFDMYKTTKSLQVIKNTEYGIYGLISANGFSEYLTGKDMLGNELTTSQRQASLSLGLAGILPTAIELTPASKAVTKDITKKAHERVVRNTQSARSFVDRWFNGLVLQTDVATAGGPRLPINAMRDTHVQQEIHTSFAKVTKGTGNGNKLKIEDFTKEILEIKPMNSPIPEKWYEKGGSISIENNGTWTYTNKSGASVSYPNGYPNFTPFMHPNVKPVKIGVHSPKNNPKDFENANKAARLTKDTDPRIIDIRRPPDGYTWHHHEDGKTMMLVDEDIHREFRHIGGQSKVNGKNK